MIYLRSSASVCMEVHESLGHLLQHPLRQLAVVHAVQKRAVTRQPHHVHGPLDDLAELVVEPPVQIGALLGRPEVIAAHADLPRRPLHGHWDHAHVHVGREPLVELHLGEAGLEALEQRREVREAEVHLLLHLVHPLGQHKNHGHVRVHDSQLVHVRPPVAEGRALGIRAREHIRPRVPQRSLELVLRDLEWRRLLVLGASRLHHVGKAQLPTATTTTTSTCLFSALSPSLLTLHGVSHTTKHVTKPGIIRRFPLFNLTTSQLGSNQSLEMAEMLALEAAPGFEDALALAPPPPPPEEDAAAEEEEEERQAHDPP
ncbi:hypothetical protein ON010_g5171 [Phytophthora cinnamomi]|nr:hypothetical protein ON010_g5171 [Phytophthora cinnamomi]